MNNKLMNGLAALFLLISAIATQVSAAELAVIVSPSNGLSRISVSELNDIYLGVADSFSNGEAAEPLDQPEQSLSRAHFIKAVLGMDERALKSYWSKLMFSGKGEPPEIVAGDAEVKRAVAANPRSIGYIDRSAVDNSVKVLLIIP